MVHGVKPAPKRAEAASPLRPTDASGPAESCPTGGFGLWLEHIHHNFLLGISIYLNINQ